MSGSKVAIDTNAAIAWLNGDPDTGVLLRKHSEVFIPVVVLGELFYGGMNSARVQENIVKLRGFVDMCTFLEITKVTAEIYGRLRFELKRKAKPIPDNDLWIAALCVEHRLPLVTSDAHFEMVEGLQLLWKR